MKNSHTAKIIITTGFAVFIAGGLCSAVTSKITRHTSAADLLKGEIAGTVIDSEGTIKLAREATEIDCGRLLKDVWIINAVVADSGRKIYILGPAQMAT